MTIFVFLLIFSVSTLAMQECSFEHQYVVSFSDGSYQKVSSKESLRTGERTKVRGKQNRYLWYTATVMGSAEYLQDHFEITETDPNCDPVAYDAILKVPLNKFDAFVGNLLRVATIPFSEKPGALILAPRFSNEEESCPGHSAKVFEVATSENLKKYVIFSGDADSDAFEAYLGTVPKDPAYFNR